VLTATGFVNGKWQFSTHHRIDTPQLITKTFVTGDYVGDPLRLCQIRCISVHGGLLGTWVKYNQNYFYSYLILRNSPTGQTRRRIFTHDGSNDADSRKDVPFGRFFHITPHLGGQKPPKNNFGAFIGVFKPNSQSRKTCILSKLMHRFHPNFAQ